MSVAVQDRPLVPGPATAGCRPGAPSCAGRGGCSAASGASRRCVLALLMVAVAATTVGSAPADQRGPQAAPCSAAPTTC